MQIPVALAAASRPIRLQQRSKSEASIGVPYASESSNTAEQRLSMSCTRDRKQGSRPTINSRRAVPASVDCLSLQQQLPLRLFHALSPAPGKPRHQATKVKFGSLILAKRQMQRSNSITLSAAELHSTKGAGTRANNQKYTVKDGTNCTCFALMHFHGNVTVPIPE